MKTFTTNSEPKITSRNRSPWRGCLFLIACALTWVELSPATRAGDQSGGAGNSSQDFFSRPYRDVILEDNPIIYWRLDETGGQTAYDQSANRNDGSYVGNPSHGLPGAIVDPDTSTKFSGSNEYLVWDPITNRCSGNFMVEAWVKESGFYLSDTFFNTSTGGARFGFDFRFDIVTLDLVQKEIRFDVGDGARWLSVSRVPFDFRAGVWYHVVAAVSETGATYYVDGSAIGYTSYIGIPLSTPLLFDSTHKIEIGANPGSSQTPRVTDNTIDEVAVYDYALTASQILAHYFAGKGIVTE